MAFRYRFRRRPVRRATEVARSLESLRRRGGYTLSALGRVLGLHPRTLRRWEIGESVPRDRQWERLLAFHRQHAPEATRALAELAGRRMPAEAKPAYDPAAATRVVVAAADALDVAPKHIRAVMLALGRAAADARLPLDAVLRASFASGVDTTDGAAVASTTEAMGGS